VIELLDIHKRFLDNVVLDGVSLDVKDGETVALLGPSGVGKSVTLKMINGLLRPDSGDVIVDGLHVPKLKRQELAELRSKIGYVFQYGALFDSMSVAENIRLGITDETCYNDAKYCTNRVLECLRLVNLPPEVAEKYPAELSGGMKKRVGIARAIAGKPKYLLYDEPTSGLDPVNADVIDGLVERLRDELGVTSVVVSHDVRGSFRVADRVALLWQAKIRAVGTAEEILASKDPAVQQFLERDLEMALVQGGGGGGPVEPTYKQEVTVGALVLVGFVVFTGFMFWLTGRSIVSKAVPVPVVFKNVSGLKEGDPVRVSGVKKGRVEQVRLIRMGQVAVTLNLDPEVRPHKDARATVASADFLGAKFVDYDPGISDTLLVKGTPIQGVTEEQFADVAQGAAKSAQELIANLNKGLNPGQLADDIHNTLIATQRGMNALTQATNGPAIQQTQATLKSLERVMSHLDTLLGAANPRETGKRLDTLSTNLTQLTSRLADATGSLKGLLDKMDRGEGTLGKMATDTILYNNLNATLKSLTELLTDLKERPGRYLTVKVF